MSGSALSLGGARWPSRLSAVLHPRAGGLLTTLALVVVALIAVVAVAAPLVAPYDPNAISLANRLAPMSSSHWLGTDEAGRDILSRVIVGSRVSIGVSLLTVTCAALIGMTLGAVAGYLGGWMEALIMRAIDVLMSFPSLVLAIALTAALGPSLVNAALAIVVIKIPLYARLAYTATVEVRDRLFVRAARVYGIRWPWVVRRHIIPNIRTSILVQSTLDLGDVILLIATLGFLGLGAQPPSPEWGSMISTGWHYLIDQWWYPTGTGAVIFITVMAFNLLGDGARDALDPTSPKG